MEPPLQVLAGKDGIFRDIHQRPMIMVFKSTEKDVPTTDESRPELKAHASPENPSFAFVQVNGSKKEDKKARTMIRAHVMQDHFRRKRQKTARSRLLKAKVSSTSIQASVAATDNRFELCPLPPQPAGSLDPFAQYPIEMNPQTYLLAHHCEYPHPMPFSLSNWKLNC